MLPMTFGFVADRVYQFIIDKSESKFVTVDGYS